MLGNVKPVLSGEEVSPESGVGEEQFTFTVTYKDEDAYEGAMTGGDWTNHANVTVTVNGQWHRMELSSGDLLTGATFVYFETFAAGTYDYYFTGDDLKEIENSVVVTDLLNFTVDPEPEENDTGEDDGLEPIEAMQYGLFALAALFLIIIVVYVVGRTMGKKKEEEEYSDEDLVPPQPPEGPPQARAAPPQQAQGPPPAAAAQTPAAPEQGAQPAEEQSGEAGHRAGEGGAAEPAGEGMPPDRRETKVSQGPGEQVLPGDGVRMAPEGDTDGGEEEGGPPTDDDTGEKPEADAEEVKAEEQPPSEEPPLEETPPEDTPEATAEAPQ